MSSFKHPHTLMVQGTTSDAGKSILVTALCRIMARHGVSVAPFKPQNMALNSAVTEEGGEIGRAQAVQAEACGLPPSVLMNPILLKPNSDIGAQVIVNGQAIGNMKAQEYHRHKPRLLEQVLAAHRTLQERHQTVMVEGAGSPAEINLRDHDIANMGFAETADCPVILVADIDRGGVFAHLYGTYLLLSESEQRRVKGFVINRFRGDIALLQSGLDWLEEKTKVPVLGVVPYLPGLHIEAEDSLNVTQPGVDDGFNRLKVAIPIYPRASNHTDFDVLRLHPGVDCRFLCDPREFRGADLVILPGSKNVRGDLAWLREQGWDKVLQRHVRLGGKVIGICGGYQMLGHSIADPDGVESAPGVSDGLGWLAINTRLTGSKTLRRVRGVMTEDSRCINVSGYEIHTGRSDGAALEQPVFELRSQEHPDDIPHFDGARNAEDTVLGTYLHGLFDEPDMLAYLLAWAGQGDAQSAFDYAAFREQQFDRLADAVEAAIPFQHWCRLLSLEPDK